MYGIGRARLYLAIIVTVLLEGTLLDLVAVGNIRPNLLLILVIFVALHSDWRGSVEAGIVGGLFRGVMTAGPVGANLLIFGLCGLLVNYCKDKVFKENPLTQLILTLLMAMVVSVLTIFAKAAVRGFKIADIDIWRSFVKTSVSMSLYTALLAPPCFFCLKRLFRVRDSIF